MNNNVENKKDNEDQFIRNFLRTDNNYKADCEMPRCRLIAMNLVSQIIICEEEIKPY